jgi:predicted RNA methylase
MDSLSLFDFSQPTLLPNAEVVAQIASNVEAAVAQAGAQQTKLERLRSVAIALVGFLRAGRKLTWDLAATAMTDAFGATEAEGAWAPQDLYNAAESGLVRWLAEDGDPSGAAIDVIAELERRDALLPPRRRRSEEGIRLQQFSTPSAYAWLAAAAASIAPGDIVLEPSAGTGLLAVFAKNAGAAVAVNELDAERLGLLEHLSPISSTDHDARYLSALYKGDKPSVVVMNPPFSIDANLGVEKRVRALALTHIDQALRIVRRGGRVVAIVGHSQSPAANRDLWNDIFSRATVRAAIALDGDVYRHMGTTFGTSLVVLDAIVDAQPPRLYREPMSLADAFNIVATIPARQHAESSGRHAGGQIVALSDLKTRTTIVDDFKFTEQPQPVQYTERHDWAAVSEEGAFATYSPQRIAINAKPHPTPLVETTALACVHPPMPTYVPLLPPGLVTSGALSDAQLEAVIYAGNAHEHEIELVEEDEHRIRHSLVTRRGWMSGYGTGVGKGRVNAAIIADNFAHGRTKAIWFSESPTLEEDARRDWKAMTGDTNGIFSLSGTPVDVSIERAWGVLFCTYATLRSRSKKTPRSRVDQIVDWAGEGFDGAIILDECHNLANAIPGSGEGMMRALQKGSLQGAAGLELQRRLPNARIVYVSATSASKIDALAYAPRLGLWGIGTAFATREDFLSKIGSGGTAAFELLCRDMKQLGYYLSASLSYEGVSYERLVHKLDEDQIAQYNVLAGAWRQIVQRMMASLSASNASRLARAAALSALESTRLRSLQAMTVAQKIPTLLTDIEAELALGHSIVIQLTNTNEAIQERALADLGEEGDLDEINLSGSQIMLDFIDRCFPTLMYEDVIGEGDTITQQPLKDKEGNPVHNPEALAVRDELKTMVATVLTPVGPLEAILDHFGTEAVAEVTGRSRRIVMRAVNGTMQRSLEDRGAHANLAEMQAFAEGTKRILLFSESAGGTGFSYHADRSFKNQQKRIHYLLQTGFRSDRALQGLGRSHRSNEAQPPAYKLVCTDIPGEMRFISIIAKRLEALGALTRGQRDAASSGIFDPSDNLETEWGSLAVAALLKRVAKTGIPGLSYDKWFDQTALALMNGDGSVRVETIPVSRFLNRVLCCDLGPNGGIQGLIMDALTEQLESVIDAAKKSGNFDLGIQAIPAIRLTKLSEQTVHRHEETGAETIVIEIEAEVKTHSTSFGQALARVRRARERAIQIKSAYFFMHQEYGIAGYYPIAASREEGRRLVPQGKIVTPTGEHIVDASYSYSFNRTIIEDDAAAEPWKTALEESGSTTTERFTMIAGTLLPIYDRLPTSNPTVYRLTMDSGERLIGRVIPESERVETLAQLGVSADNDPARAYTVAKTGSRVKLGNGWQVKSSRLGGIPRLEVLVPAHQAMRAKNELLSRGLLTETVAYVVRYFIPTGTQEEGLFGRLVTDFGLAA